MAEQLLTAYKCTRSDGTDHRTGTVNYRAHLLSGEPMVHPDPDPALFATTGNVCGKGFHVSPTAILATTFGDRSHRPFAWFEVQYERQDLIEADTRKMRLLCVRRVVRELAIKDVFGVDFHERIAAVQADILTWKTIPWLKPTSRVCDEEIERLVADRRAAMMPYMVSGKSLPAAVRVVRSHVVAAAAAAADAAAAVVDAAVDAADAAVAAVAAAANAVDAAVDAAAVAAAVDAAVAAAANAAFGYYRWWNYHLRPYRTFRTHARWKIAGLNTPCPASPLVELYRLGCWPIGYVKGEFVVYAPEPR